jgi:hypothetical protein
VEGRKTLVILPNGEQIISYRTFYIDGAAKPTGMSVKDRLTYQGIAWPILGYAEFFDEKGGLYYVEVYI